MDSCKMAVALKNQRIYPKLLVLEPLYGASHKKLIDNVLMFLPETKYTLITMPPKRWDWRSRVSALFMAEKIPRNHDYEVLFCSSVLPLSDLIGLRPDLSQLYKIVYFHENQFSMSIKCSRDLKFELTYNEIRTSLVADQVLFNSAYNKNMFLDLVTKHKKTHMHLPNLVTFEKAIILKSVVVSFPINTDLIDMYVANVHKIPSRELNIIWPHRWEFDRPPEMFYRVIRCLGEAGFSFKIYMLPQSFMKGYTTPNKLKKQFRSPHLTYVENAESNLRNYYTMLKRADVIVSTAQSEFFPCQILEGMYCDLIPVIPKNPVFQEIFKNKIGETYKSETELFHILADLCCKKQADALRITYKRLCNPFKATTFFHNLMQVLEMRN